MKINDRHMELAGAIWATPPNTAKVLDVEMATTIAQCLANFEEETVERCVAILKYKAHVLPRYRDLIAEAIGDMRALLVQA
jgi:hypothetical protein